MPHCDFGTRQITHSFTGMNIDSYGFVEPTETEMFNALYSGVSFATIAETYPSTELAAQFNSSIEANYDQIRPLQIEKPNYGLSQEEFNAACRDNWLMPDEYKTMDVESVLLGKCCTDVERARVVHELGIYKQQNLLPLLQYMVYLVDQLRKNNVVWGVGRGSSVSSYCLYLIGVHKVDSIKYNLPIEDFLK